MRSHGVRSFPDPGADGGIHVPPGSAIDKRSPAFQAASRACRALAPGGIAPHLGPSGLGLLTGQARAQLQRQLLALAQCMRALGVHAFPDPTGDLKFQPDPDHPIDEHSPAFTAAAAACQHALSPENRRRIGGPSRRGGK
jgi:hypothetical protein